MPRRFAALLVPLAVGLLGACGSDVATSSSAPGTAGADRLLVVTTTTQVTDFARNVGGDLVDVHPLLKPNVDPHDFEPAAADLVALTDADVIVENGVDLEHWFEPTVESASPHGAIVDASTGVTIRAGSEDDDHGEGDPHIWQDPTNAKIMATNIADALATADPANAATYRANLAAYSAQLDQLDAEIATQIGSLTDKKLVTNHDAFAYYVARYGLDFVGSVIPSFDTQAELSPSDVQDLVARIREQGVKAIFTESSLPPKTAEAIAAEAGVKVVAGDDGLYGDSLGPAGSDGDTYLKMMRHNTRVIVQNLR
ncbi:MAG: metal ABC transporter substrate-binding protein [Ilumatobacteraceae bacterium]